jgi:hypothetical protein
MHFLPVEKYVPLRVCRFVRVCRFGNYVPGAGEGGDAARRERLRVRRGHHDKSLASHRQGREKAQHRFCGADPLPPAAV